MVCAFVTNQQLHEQTSSSSTSPANDNDNDDDKSSDDKGADKRQTADDIGLVTSLVNALYDIDSYQQSTSQVSSGHCLCLTVCLSVCDVQVP